MGAVIACSSQNGDGNFVTIVFPWFAYGLRVEPGLTV